MIIHGASSAYTNDLQNDYAKSEPALHFGEEDAKKDEGPPRQQEQVSNEELL